jgi:hypothetical protein
VIWGDIAAPLSLPDLYGVFIFIKIIRLAKNYSLGKNALLTLVVCVLHLWLEKEPSSNNWQKTFVGKNCLSVCDVHQCILVIL